MTSTNRSVIAAPALAFVLAGAATAHADGYRGSVKDAPAPVVYEQYVWDGMYVAFGGGWRQHDDDNGFKGQADIYDYYYDYGTYYDDFRFGDDDWNGFGTAQIGYDHTLHGKFLIGVFADVDFNLEDDDDHFFRYYGDYAYADAKIETDLTWSVGGRLGFLVMPRLLVYGVAGYTETRLDGHIGIHDHHGNKLWFDAPDSLDGYFVGAGAEIALHSNLFFKAEYRYTELDEENGSKHGVFHYGDCDCDHSGYYADVHGKADWEAEVHSVRGAIVLKFGGHDRRPAVEPLK